jgi:hypothetical protein
VATNINNALDEFVRHCVNLDPEETKSARASRDWLLAQIRGFPTADDSFPRAYQEVDILLGSFHRRTKVRPLDDVDLITGLHAEGATYTTYPDHIRLNVPEGSPRLLALCHDGSNVLNSKRVLNRFVSALSGVPQYRRADIGRDGEAAVVELVSYGWSFDVVPAFFTKPEADGRTYYLIPDGNGHWKKTDPRMDDQRLSAVLAQHGEIVLPTIRLLKYWNKRRTVPTVRSYVLESMILNHYEQAPVSTHKYIDLEFRNALATLALHIHYPVMDPKGIQGDMNTLSAAERLSLSTRAFADVALVDQALVAERLQDHRSAMARWREIVGDAFPPYG